MLPPHAGLTETAGQVPTGVPWLPGPLCSPTFPRARTSSQTQKAPHTGGLEGCRLRPALEPSLLGRHTPLWMTVRWLALGTSERLLECGVEGWQGQGLTFPPSLFPSCCQFPGNPVSNRGLLTCEVGPAGVLGGLWHWIWLTATEMCPPRLSRFPGTFVGTTEPASPPLSSTSPTTTAATMPVEPSVAGLAPPGEAALCLEEVAPPASGTRKARVLYDYEAADSSELALLADEVGLGATRVAAKGWLTTPGQWDWERWARRPDTSLRVFESL